MIISFFFFCKVSRIVDAPSEDEFVGFKDSESEDVICSQFHIVHTYIDKSCSNVEMVSEAGQLRIFSVPNLIIWSIIFKF